MPFNTDHIAVRSLPDLLSNFIGNINTKDITGIELVFERRIRQKGGGQTTAEICLYAVLVQKGGRSLISAADRFVFPEMISHRFCQKLFVSELVLQIERNILKIGLN